MPLLNLSLSREIAFDSFKEIMEAKKKPEDLLDGFYKNYGSKLKRIDRNFIKEIVYGSLRWYKKLYWILQNTSKRDLDKSSWEIKAALVLGTYQIYYMDKVPDRAAVNESVEYIRKRGQASACSFVNGILRQIARRGFVLNLSSILGVCPRPGAASYSATNSYVIQFSRALNMELRHTGVRVTTVCPGTADTASMDAPVPVKSRRGEERFRIAGIAVDRMFAGPTVAATTCRNRLFLLWLRPMRWLDRMRALFYKRSPQLSVADSGEPVEETPLEA